MTQPQKIFIASDHAGYELKNELIQTLKNLPWHDLGPQSKDSVDYPDYANLVVQKLKDSSPNSLGVLICGSGQGMAIRANRFAFIRAALCFTPEMAKLSREHNNANVLCMGAKFLDTQKAKQILESFLITNFEGGRHERRVNKLSEGC